MRSHPFFSIFANTYIFYDNNILHEAKLGKNFSREKVEVVGL
ncbi:hypothetical protein KKC1_17710 [Calderihabitans maritimus]|uniref:Uncharacterized protein n=1 Tax=Calderihabitans maritimus TaxID=1246530 RepID=A0A1Z5HTM1_9FIRM|nr:hypothetical protein KKC1_17710 [Calderihabitans maritimus]